MKENKLTFKTSEGSWRLFLIFLALVLLFSAIANVIQTQGYQYQVKKIFLDTKGGYLQYAKRKLNPAYLDEKVRKRIIEQIKKIEL